MSHSSQSDTSNRKENATVPISYRLLGGSQNLEASDGRTRCWKKLTICTIVLIQYQTILDNTGRNV